MKGFLLIEALISIVILSVALVACMTVSSQGLRLAKRSELGLRENLEAERTLFDTERNLRL